MADTNQADLIIIGAGPGGYVAAIKAAQLGLKVMLVDKCGVAGGTCLNVGCIPSKALLHSSHKYYEAKTSLAKHGVMVPEVMLDLVAMMKRKEKVVSELTKGIGFLFGKNKVTFLQGEATFLAPNEVSVTNTNGEKQAWRAPAIVIATGSESTPLPGIEIDEEVIVSSTGALSLKTVPEELVVIGGGYIGVELGSVWSRLGSKVTVVEAMDRICPALDKDVGAGLQKALTSQGMTFLLGQKVSSLKKEEKRVTLSLESMDGKKGESLGCDVALVSIGRRPFTAGLNLEKIGVKLNERGYIVVDAHFQTSCPGVYAIGDVIPGPMLAHKAEEEGVAVAEIIAGQKGHVNYGVIPSVVYTNPEAAGVGKTEDELKKEGVSFKVGKFPFSANSRAKAVGEVAGFVKILTDEKDKVLGVHMLGEMAGTLIAEAALAMEFSASAEDIARTCHAHPTHSEAVKEAALAAAFNTAIHA